MNRPGAVPEWSPSVVIDARLVRALVGEQFPQIDIRSPRLLGEGWDNSVWVVDDQWAFRFPRREIAVAGVEREVAILPGLAPLLPLPIPTPVFIGRPCTRLSVAVPRRAAASGPGARGPGARRHRSRCPRAPARGVPAPAAQR